MTDSGRKGEPTEPLGTANADAVESAANGSNLDSRKSEETDAQPSESPNAQPSSDEPATDADERPRKKKKKKKKKPKADPELSPEELAKAGELAKGATEARERKRTKIWVTVIATVLCVELYVFGSRGEIEACVGREGQTDFALTGAARNDKNRARVPMCEARYNVGMRSVYDDAKEEALYAACRRATMIRGDRERAACFGSLAGWQKQMTTRFVWPWEKAFYQRMFWFAF